VPPGRQASPWAAPRRRVPPAVPSADAGAAQVGRPFFRAVRAGVFAVVCVAVSLAVHVLAGGAVVRPGVLGATVALTAVGAYLLAGRQRGFAGLLVACFGAQYGMHRVFSLAVAEPTPYDIGASTPPGAFAMPGHPHGGGFWLDVAMLLLHTLTAVVSAWWLEREEAALATLLHLLAASVLGLWARLAPSPAPPVAVPDCARPPVPERTGTALARLLAVTVSRRGPPAGGSVSSHRLSCSSA